jgi:hypothetical protein
MRGVVVEEMPMQNLRMLGLLWLCLLVACGGGGGGGGGGLAAGVVNKANFDKLQTGMSVQEVEAILGQGKALRGADEVELSNVEDMKKFMRPELAKGKYVKWGGDTRFILVVFVDDKAALTHAQGL